MLEIRVETMEWLGRIFRGAETERSRAVAGDGDGDVRGATNESADFGTVAGAARAAAIGSLAILILS